MSWDIEVSRQRIWHDHRLYLKYVLRLAQVARQD